jgi:hypothetical protein
LAKGHLQTVEDVKESKKQLEAFANDTLKNYNNRKKLISKKYKKSQRGKMAYQETNKEKKESVDKFWDYIDKL